MDQRPIQDQLGEVNYCWGCGPFNDHGLHIKSYWTGDEAVCTWQPSSYHSAGPLHIVNGGIIATLIDCHCACTAMATAYQAEGREIGSEPLIWYATVSLQVSYLHPVPINDPLTLRGRVKEMGDRKAIVTCSLFAKGEECARGEVVAVRVPPDAWFEAE